MKNPGHMQKNMLKPGLLALNYSKQLMFFGEGNGIRKRLEHSTVKAITN